MLEKKNNINITIIGTTSIIVISSIILGYHYYYKSVSKNNIKKKYSEDFSYEYYPPLPNPVVSLLNASRLCHLATQHNNDPHLSLMNFTYYQEEEILIMTTRRDTKKYDHMKNCNKVAVLIHDFPNLEIDKNKTSGNTVSITLNGISNIIYDENIASKYRY